MPQRRVFLNVYIALMALLAATIGAWYIDFGRANLFIALSIAIAKAVLVVLFFMGVKKSGRLIWVYASAGAVWLLIALVLSLADYFTRSALLVPRG